MTLPAEEPMLEVIATSCDEGNCPTFSRDTETGEAVIRGYLPDGTETDVRQPWEAFLRLVAQVRE
jgi:hypothetical protein